MNDTKHPIHGETPFVAVQTHTEREMPRTAHHSNPDPSPPTPPPLPMPAHPHPHHLLLARRKFKIAENETGFWDKFGHAQGAFCEVGNPDRLMIQTAGLQAGPYFFYGSLMDPSMLQEVLGLEALPSLRPAEIVGYSCKMWGQYPALIKGPQGATVRGVVYDVQDREHAVRLASYETKAYRTAPCEISCVDTSEQSPLSGTVFLYAGPLVDLDDGGFDLNIWLQRMGRAKRVDC
ncbi:poly polymerase [Phlyctema vagabunda]|uniref:Putative gamma-glutamylcyclotransferase n=1 Tax=Phlyctema vagabunda TaxID=108571 RepID=A0ABR4P1B3_9HELO